MKKISFIVDTQEDDIRIESHLIRWIKDNFTNSEKVKVKIEEVKKLEEVANA